MLSVCSQPALKTFRQSYVGLDKRLHDGDFQHVEPRLEGEDVGVLDHLNRSCQRLVPSTVARPGSAASPAGATPYGKSPGSLRGPRLHSVSLSNPSGSLPIGRRQPSQGPRGLGVLRQRRPFAAKGASHVFVPADLHTPSEAHVDHPAHGLFQSIQETTQRRSVEEQQ